MNYANVFPFERIIFAGNWHNFPVTKFALATDSNARFRFTKIRVKTNPIQYGNTARGTDSNIYCLGGIMRALT